MSCCYKYIISHSKHPLKLSEIAPKKRNLMTKKIIKTFAHNHGKDNNRKSKPTYLRNVNSNR